MFVSTYHTLKPYSSGINEKQNSLKFCSYKLLLKRKYCQYTICKNFSICVLTHYIDYVRLFVPSSFPSLFIVCIVGTF